MPDSCHPDIAVAIATLDRPDGLARCLDGLLAGTVLPAQVVVVDQGSDARARPVLEARAHAGPTVVWLGQERLGLSASRNLAAAATASRILAVTDDDCVPDARWVEGIVGAFAGGDPPAVVTGRVLAPAGAEGYAISLRTGTVRREMTSWLAPWTLGTGGNLAIDREWLRHVGGYDERLGAGSGGRAGEDMDLLYRIRRAGGRILYEPDAIVYHARQSRARRLETRRAYAHGIAAACSLRLREGDSRALLVGLRWAAALASDTARSAARMRSFELRQRFESVVGTLQGARYGWTVTPRRVRAGRPSGEQVRHESPR